MVTPVNPLEQKVVTIQAQITESQAKLREINAKLPEYGTPEYAQSEALKQELRDLDNKLYDAQQAVAPAPESATAVPVATTNIITPTALPTIQSDIDSLTKKKSSADATVAHWESQDTKNDYLGKDNHTVEDYQALVNSYKKDAAQASLNLATATSSYTGTNSAQNTPFYVSTLGAASQADRASSEVLVNQKLLQAQGVTGTNSIATSVEIKNGVATITTEGGRTIKVPADEYEVLVKNQQLTAQDTNARTEAYNAWASNNPGFGPANSDASITAFTQENDKRIAAGETPLYASVKDTAIATQAQSILDKNTTKVSNPPPVTGGDSQVSSDSSTLSGSKPISADDAKKIDAAGSSNTPPAPGAAPTKAEVIANSPVVKASTSAGSTGTAADKLDKVSKDAATLSVDDKGVVTDQAAAAASSSNTPAATKNPLDNYTSYTYGIALHLLTKGEFNSIMTSGVPAPKHTLIASGGRGAASGITRDPNWTENFYFEDLKIQTFVGMNSGQAGTNAIDLSFTIIEPMGLSFLDRLVVTCANLGQTEDGGSNAEAYRNHLDMPYLLQIDFFDSETGPISNLRKWIPIRLLECKIKVTQRGSEYRLRATPYQHAAYTTTVVETPTNFNITAKTLTDFFASGASTVTTAGLARDAAQASAQAAHGVTGNEKTYSLTSFVDAYNNFAATLAKNTQYMADDKADKRVTDQDFNKIDVRIHPSFLSGSNGEIVNPAQQSVKKVPMASKDHDHTQPAPPIDFSYTGMHIPAGTQVTQVINNVMGMTQFIRSQLADPSNPEGGLPAEASLNWYKIVPTIKLNKFSNATGKWSYTVTYWVVPYKLDNVKHPLAPSRIVTPAMAVKSYQYLYTGQNTSVLDLQMDFDFAYYTAMTVQMQKGQLTAGDSIQPPDASNDGAHVLTLVPSTSTSATTTQDQNKRSSWAPLVYHFQTEAVSSKAFGKRDDSKQIVTASVADSVYSGSMGDMLKIMLKINGDPDFIKQDEVLITPAKDLQNYGKSLPNNSLIMDSGDVIINVRVMIPNDYNESTGDIQSKNMSGFSGVYRVVTVENIFSKGKFEQTLECYRYYNQIDSTSGTANKNNGFNVSAAQRTTDKAEQNVAAVAGAPAANADVVGAVDNSNTAGVINAQQMAKVFEQTASAKTGADTLPDNTALVQKNNWAGTDSTIIPAQNSDFVA